MARVGEVRGRGEGEVGTGGAWHAREVPGDLYTLYFILYTLYGAWHAREVPGDPTAWGSMKHTDGQRTRLLQRRANVSDDEGRGGRSVHKV